MIDMHTLLLPLVFGVGLALSNYYRCRYEKSYIPRTNLPLFPPRFDFHLIFPLLSIYLRLNLFYLYRAEDIFAFVIVFVLTLTGGIGFLLLLLPALRKILRAESCALLWLVPCFLLLFSGSTPQWCISLPFPPPNRQAIRTLAWIWFAGFAAVMLWNILTHLLFRQHLLKNAKQVEDDAYQQVWLQQLKIANLPTTMISLRISSNTQTPLSIGLFWRTSYLVLPERAYSPEELTMVLQHELIHISRRDSIMKFVMSVCAAHMWFHPLAWIALRVCAQDLELSCDEAVVYGRSEQSRMEYAKLLLHTAPRQLGFTSCLSSVASSLRYRMKNVVAARKRISGSIIIGFLSFLLLLGGTCTGIRYRALSASELLFTEYDANQLEVGDVMSKIDGVNISGECAKDQLVLDYIAALSLQKTTEKPDVFSTSKRIQLVIHAPGHNYILNFGNGYLRVVTVTFSESNRWKTTFYRLDRDPDFQFLISCIYP